MFFRKVLSCSIFCIAALTPNPSFAQSNVNLPKLHSLAPALHLQSVQGASTGVQPELSHLRGKVVVLEFWATWCAPCIGEIPAINALVKSLDPAKVQFISITDEDPAKVAAFLKKKPISGWVGIDTTSGVFDRYGVVSRPATVVIDPQGKVVSNSLSPDQLSRAQLLSLAQSKARTLSAVSDADTKSKTESARSEAMKEQFSEAGAGPAKDALFSLSLTPSNGGEQTHFYSTSAQSFDLLDASVKTLLQMGVGYNSGRITMDEDAFKDHNYNLSLHTGDVPDDQLKAALELAIASAVSAHIEHHRAEEDVLLLRPVSVVAADPTAKKLAGLAVYNRDKETAILMNASPNQIASAAEDAIGIPVHDEAGSSPACSSNFKVKKGDLDSLRSQMEKQCGLTLVAGRKVVDRITVTPVVVVAEK